jgi:hypothetical protein
MGGRRKEERRKEKEGKDVREIWETGVGKV